MQSRIGIVREVKKLRQMRGHRAQIRRESSRLSYLRGFRKAGGVRHSGEPGAPDMEQMPPVSPVPSETHDDLDATQTLQPRARTADEAVRITRFIAAMNQALAVNLISQRELARRMGVESGTFTKYMRGVVDPLRTGSGIQAGLARALGVTMDSLFEFYEGGEYLAGVTADQVESWIRSEAGQQDLPEILAALQEAGQRWLVQSTPEPTPVSLPRYEWPIEVITALGYPDAVLKRLGVTSDALEQLAATGEFADDFLMGFADAIERDPEEVRQAFETRTAL